VTRTLRIGLIAAAAALALAAVAGTDSPGTGLPVPVLTGRVVDEAHVLSATTVANLEGQLAGLERAKGSQVAVLTVPTTQPEEMEQFSIRVADQWKLGRKGIEDGVILLVARDDHTVRIEVGRGLEGALTDTVASRIIDEEITPRFRQGDYDGGVNAGITRIVAVINGEPLPPPQPARTAPRRVNGLGNLLPVLLVGALIVSRVLRALLGSLFGSLATGGVAGFIAYLITHALLVGLGAGAIAFLFALFAGATGGWYGGGGGFVSGGSGFSGGGGGGFSGGGGGFAGGGATGRW
jgi:uncharacterized protein